MNVGDIKGRNRSRRGRILATIVLGVAAITAVVGLLRFGDAGDVQAVTPTTTQAMSARVRLIRNWVSPVATSLSVGQRAPPLSSGVVRVRSVSTTVDFPALFSPANTVRSGWSVTVVARHERKLLNVICETYIPTSTDHVVMSCVNQPLTQQSYGADCLAGNRLRVAILTLLGA